MPELWDGLNAATLPADVNMWPDAQRAPLRITVGGPAMKDGSQSSGSSLDPFNPPQVEYVGKPLARTLASMIGEIGRKGQGLFGHLLNAEAERTGQVPAVSTDYDPQSEAIKNTTDLASYVTMAPSVTGGVPAGALGMAARSGPLWSPFSDAKMRVPLNELEHRYIDVRAPVPKFVNPEQLLGGRGIFTESDLSAANRTATHLVGEKLDRPVVAHGGIGFPEANPGLGWASEQAIARRLDNQAAKLAEEGKGPVYIMPMTMSPMGIDASHHVADPLAQLVQKAPIKRADATAFNEMMREKVPDWVSIRSPKFQDYISNLKGGMTTKSYMADRMALREWQDKGFPNVAGVRHGMSIPELADLPSATVGMAISKYIPGKGLIETTHPSYSKGVAADFLGQLPTLVPFDAIAPTIDKALAAKNAANLAMGKEVAIRPGYHMQKPTQGIPTHQEFNDEWLNNLMARIKSQEDKR